MKVLVFAGSTRTGSWNRKLAQVVASMTHASGADAFDAQGDLAAESARKSVQAVIDQVLWAATRLNV